MTAVCNFNFLLDTPLGEEIFFSLPHTTIHSDESGDNLPSLFKKGGLDPQGYKKENLLPKLFSIDETLKKEKPNRHFQYMYVLICIR